MPLARALLLIHVMPWFLAPPTSEAYGWHWTMGRLDPNTGAIASHYRPLIGPYDSLDPHVLELQVGWMKLAGFDGVLVDWYGINDTFDYSPLHRRTEALFEVAERAGLKIGVVYEDQSIGNAIKAGHIQAGTEADEARRVGAWMREHWLGRPSWLRLREAPSVAVFGPQAFGDREWQAFRDGAGEVDVVPLHHPRPGLNGVFDWPVPSQGLAWTDDFLQRAGGAAPRMAVAYPRFHDWYEEGGQPGHADLDDRLGATYALTLEQAVGFGVEAIQVATWNDWQEGTQIEPSVEFGLRDLLITQQARRRLDPAFAFTAADLELPLELFRLRKRTGLDHREIGTAILEGQVATARRLLGPVPRVAAEELR